MSSFNLTSLHGLKNTKNGKSHFTYQLFDQHYQDSAEVMNLRYRYQETQVCHFKTQPRLRPTKVWISVVYWFTNHHNKSTSVKHKS